MRNRDSKHAVFTVLLVCVLTFVMTACSQESGDAGAVPETKPVNPSILLITLDTTRADSLGIETDRVGTPNLEALAGRGVYYKQAYSVTPTTLPSHTSMLTGLYPADHRVRENGRVIDKELKRSEERL